VNLNSKGRLEITVVTDKKTGEQRRITDSLLAHLEMGGTRQGACGSAGISFRELCARMEADPEFAEALEEAECRGLAADEKRLATDVEDGNRQSLLFRLRRAYQSGKNGKRAGVKKADESTAKEYERITCKFGELPEEDRRKMVEKLRGDPAPAGAVA
jgi:hypothetical protein